MAGYRDHREEHATLTSRRVTVVTSPSAGVLKLVGAQHHRRASRATDRADHAAANPIRLASGVVTTTSARLVPMNRRRIGAPGVTGRHQPRWRSAR